MSSVLNVSENGEVISASQLVVSKPKARSKTLSIREAFKAHLGEITIEKIKKPWMAHKSFHLLDTTEKLATWVDEILADPSRRQHTSLDSGRIGDSYTLPDMPVVATDTETTGLDTRIVGKYQADGTIKYATNVDIAGVCLSTDGIEGVYIPINHEMGNNVSREDARIHLQRLFDNTFQVYYNAKFDREILRITLNIDLKEYPQFEDVQIMQYLCDPKASMEGDSKSYGEVGGLKSLSSNLLGIDQIELDELTKLRARFFDTKTQKNTIRKQMVPFTWVPTDIALWYAASDAICTWLLWEKLRELARSRMLVHRIDHELIDTITWIERQRFLIDQDKHRRVTSWHKTHLSHMVKDLMEQAKRDGWDSTTNGNFLPSSTQQLGKLLYDIKRFKVLKKTATGGRSTDAEVLSDLQTMHPDDTFLNLLSEYKDYVALHPDNLAFDPNDSSARIHLRQCVVAGGRLSASGGKFEKDGGFGLNIQAIKRVEGNWWVKGRVLAPDSVNPEEVEPHEECELHASCFRDGVKAKGIINNHIANYLGYSICLVPGCETCHDKFGTLWESGRLDVNEVVNLRSMFTAPEGWSFACTDYCNIEMRAAANCSKEPLFVDEFLIGSGDFHTLTASRVFPEFNNPKTDKAARKQLRSYAKILNFALLYGGTEYTIFQNMKKVRPDITLNDAYNMVDRYWASVPTFRDWCNKKKQKAADQLTVRTTTGRVISFASELIALRIRKPTRAEKDIVYNHRNLQKKLDNLIANDSDPDVITRVKQALDNIYQANSAAIENAAAFHRFVGKAERRSMNIPLQGLAGDFMRMALNRIRIWATKREPNVQDVLRLHGTVHDEIDYAIKNEYLPFVVPRLTRFMKLRAIHKQQGWPVPIECDTEYGQSWDVVHHLTGDTDHPAEGWSQVKGMEEYLPHGYNLSTVDSLVSSLLSDSSTRVDKAHLFLSTNLHERAYKAVESELRTTTDPARCRNRVIVALQLHEFWTVDGTSELQDSSMESLEEFEKRCGLIHETYNTPPFKFLETPPAYLLERPKIERSDDVEPEPVVDAEAHLKKVAKAVRKPAAKAKVAKKKVKDSTTMELPLTVEETADEVIAEVPPVAELVATPEIASSVVEHSPVAVTVVPVPEEDSRPLITEPIEDDVFSAEPPPVLTKKNVISKPPPPEMTPPPPPCVVRHEVTQVQVAASPVHANGTLEPIVDRDGVEVYFLRSDITNDELNELRVFLGLGEHRIKLETGKVVIDIPNIQKVRIPDKFLYARPQ